MKASAHEPAVDIDETLLRNWPLPMPPTDGDKEQKGRILLVGGSPEMPGAIMLVATAALRAGAGKLTVATASSVAPLVAAQIPEAKVIALAEDPSGALAPGALQAGLEKIADRFDAVVIGPGFESSPCLLDDILALLPKFTEAKVVLDACAMDVVSLPEWKQCERSMPPMLLTPHAGEMAHLTGWPKSAVKEQPEEILQRTTIDWQAVVALKGASTLIASPAGTRWRYQGGNSGLGVSGSGDTLAGVIGGLAARGASLEQACVWGVALHARAGTALAEKYGPVGYLAREISGEIPRLMHALSPA
ncbi:MAG: NAD(P)H-hydrate dehydratase [Pseudomonadota bacterium]